MLAEADFEEILDEGQNFSETHHSDLQLPALSRCHVFVGIKHAELAVRSKTN